MTKHPLWSREYEAFKTELRMLNRKMDKLEGRYNQIIILIKALMDFVQNRSNQRGVDSKVKAHERMADILQFVEKVIDESNRTDVSPEEKRDVDLVSQLIKQGVK